VLYFSSVFPEMLVYILQEEENTIFGLKCFPETPVEKEAKTTPSDGSCLQPSPCSSYQHPPVPAVTPFLNSRIHGKSGWDTTGWKTLL